MKLSELFETSNKPEAKFVIAKVSITYMIDEDTDKTGLVTLYTECDSAKDASELAKKMIDKDLSDEDLVNHYAQNAFDNFESVQGGAFINSATVATRPPTAGRKVFSFNLKDFNFDSFY